MRRHGGDKARPGGRAGERGDHGGSGRGGMRGAGTLFELAFSFAGTMLAGMAVGYYGGRWLDAWWGTAPWLQLAGLMLGVVAAFRVLWRTLQRVEEPPQGPPAGPERPQGRGKEGNDS